MKFCSYFPYNAKLCINGHEGAKRQAAKAGIAFEALDNGFAAVEDARAATRSGALALSGLQHGQIPGGRERAHHEAFDPSADLDLVPRGRTEIDAVAEHDRL